ncbi:MAG: VWA domain-containing protein [Chloroflexi bacterium]|nr:VWA domain-containing protein [Chloroflexota bacterium]
MSKIFDYYTILGIDSQADNDTIRVAFETLQNSFPPSERNPANNPDYQRIVNAFEVLSDPVRRDTYDSLLIETTMIDLDIEVVSSRDQIDVSDSDQRLYVLVDIRPPKQSVGQQLPLNLCLVIDRSTSMHGRRLEAVRAAVELVVEKLSPSDVLSIVSFSDRADIVSPAEPLTNKTIVISHLRSIQASGGTEIYQGLNAGFKEMQQVNLEQHTNHLILLTDGHTYGDEKQCLALANRAAAERIGFTAFGIGADWNDHFLDALVSPSGGQTSFIEAPQDVVARLEERIKGLGTIYAQNMHLVQNFPDFIKLVDGFKLVPFAQPLNLEEDKVKLGNVEGRSRLAFLLEINIDPQLFERRFIVPISLAANIPARQMQEQTFNENMRLQVLTGPAKEAPPEAIVEAVRILNMYRMNERVWEDVEAGNIDGATTRMRHLTTRLLEAGEPKLAQQATVEMKRISNAGTMSLEGRKKLKFGTRSLISRTKYFDNDD